MGKEEQDNSRKLLIGAGIVVALSLLASTPEQRAEAKRTVDALGPWVGLAAALTVLALLFWPD